MLKCILVMSKVLFRVVVYTGVISAFLFIVGGVIYVNFIEERFDFENKGIENVGVVTRRKGTSKSMDEITHYVDGVRYRVGFIAQLPGLTIGEKFYLLYNPDDPQDAFVQRWRPLFLPNERTGKTNGAVTYITEVGFGVKAPAVDFEYVVEKEKITRTQEIPQDYKTQFPTLSEGQHFEVEYWQENPKRAIIYLDRPVRE